MTTENMNAERSLLYAKYLLDAMQCANMEEAQRLIDQVANDTRISDRKYSILRRIAIKSAYNEN